MKNTILVTKIQPFSVHDGPGIRTTVFLKGCSLKCQWCANPECIDVENEYWFDKDKCITKEGKGCTLSADCKKCPIDAMSLVAQEYSTDELLNQLLKYNPFYNDNGGVTFSGGEALLQIDQLEPVLEGLKEEKINICFETALHVHNDRCKKMLYYADELYVDIKNVLNASEKFFVNLKMINNSGIKYTVRIPLVKPYTYNKENLEAVKQLLKTIKPQKIEIFSAHTLAQKKYEMLGKKFIAYDNVSNDELLVIAKELNAEVLSIY